MKSTLKNYTLMICHFIIRWKTSPTPMLWTHGVHLRTVADYNVTLKNHKRQKRKERRQLGSTTFCISWPSMLIAGWVFDHKLRAAIWMGQPNQTQQNGKLFDSWNFPVIILRVMEVVLDANTESKEVSIFTSEYLMREF